MLLREFDYERPATIEDALRALAAHDGARVLAGGQTLTNVMKLRVISPDVVVDVTRIPELKRIAVDEDGWLSIGATATYTEIARADEVKALRPLVAEVAGMIADVQVRNRGTIGGNVCLNLSTSHFPPVAVALGAEMTIAAASGERTVPADAFFHAPFTTAVALGELLTNVRFPPRGVGEGDAFVAMSAGKESQSVVHAVGSIRAGAKIEDARTVVGCVAPRPVRALEVEQALVGAEPEAESARVAVAGLGERLDPVDDVNASSRFKRHVAEVVTRRALEQAIERARMATP